MNCPNLLSIELVENTFIPYTLIFENAFDVICRIIIKKISTFYMTQRNIVI